MQQIFFSESESLNFSLSTVVNTDVAEKLEYTCQNEPFQLDETH